MASSGPAQPAASSARLDFHDHVVQLQEAGAAEGYRITITDCAESPQSYNKGLAIAALFAVLVVSLLGFLAPVAIASWRKRQAYRQQVALAALAFVGFAILLTVAFIHILGDAAVDLASPCLPSGFTSSYPSYALLACTCTIMVMLLLDYCMQGYIERAVGGALPAGAAAALDPCCALVEGGQACEQREQQEGQEGQQSKHQQCGQQRRRRHRQQQQQQPGEEAPPCQQQDLEASCCCCCCCCGAGEGPSPGGDLEQQEQQWQTQEGLQDCCCCAAGGEPSPRDDSEQQEQQCMQRQQQQPGRDLEACCCQAGRGPKPRDSAYASSSDSDEAAEQAALRARRAVVVMVEVSVCTHSIPVGLDLGLNPSIALFVAIVFHQLLEGLGVGAAVVEARYSTRAAALLSLPFALTAPAGVALGLGLHSSLNPASSAYLYTLGFVNAVASGLLLYTAFHHMNAFVARGAWLRRQGWRVQALCLGAFLLAGGAMLAVGRWA